MHSRLSSRVIMAKWLVFAVLFWGCADRTPVEESEQAVQTVEQRESEPEADGDETVLEEVDWEEAQRRSAIAAGRLSEQAQKLAADSPVPLLLPDDDELLGSLHLTLGDAWYAASMRGAEHSVVFNGTHRTHRAPKAGGAKEDDHPREEGHTLTRTHGIVTLTFEEFGVAYAIDVECERPLENRLCVEDDYVLSLAENAGVAGESQ